MRHRRYLQLTPLTLIVFSLLTANLLIAATLSAQDVVTTPDADMTNADLTTPSVTVNDQAILNNRVRVANVVSDGQGFIAIHIDADGAPGPIIGYRAVNSGQSVNVDVLIDASTATPTLYAMLHTDDGTLGTYEFDGQSGLDNPVAVDGQVVTPAFAASILSVSDQVAGDSVTVNNAIMNVDGWVVIHADADGAPGPVLGQTLVEAGNTASVVVELTLEGRTASVWPMLHVDDGSIGTYEFNGQSGLDNPIVANGQVVTTQLWTVPHVRAADQVVLAGDNTPMTMTDTTPTITAESVFSDGPGVLVVHLDANGQPGPVAGWQLVNSGLTRDVVVNLDQEVELTPIVWPMLHVDDGNVGTYEFDGRSGLDNPISVDGQVVTFPINIAPSMTLTDQVLGRDFDDNANGIVSIASALIDAPGWLVIHQSTDSAPGPVLGTYPLVAGLNEDIAISVNTEAAGEQVFPMLHYDTGALGMYEFGSVEGADLPTVFGGSVVVGPVAINGQAR